MPRAAAKSCLLWLANSMLLLSIPVIFWFTMECIKSIPFRAGHDPSPLSPDILGNSNHMGKHPNRHQSGIRFRLIDQPNSSPHKIHQRPMPKVGGLAIILAIISINLLAGNLKSDIIRVILLASIIAFLFGLWDDTHRLSPRWKLVGQSDKLNMALTLIWTIGITNAFNFVDSMDGLAIGLAAIASASFMLVTADAGQPALSLLSAILLGSCIGMLYFNALPARTFLGRFRRAIPGLYPGCSGYSMYSSRSSPAVFLVCSHPATQRSDL